MRTTRTSEAAAFGAALLAGVGAGVFEDVAEACARCVKWSEEVYRPREELTAWYRAQMKTWREAGPVTRLAH